MWWNFVARSHDEIVAQRAQWQAQLERAAAGGDRGGPFGAFPDEWRAVLPAPELPTVRLRPRQQGRSA